MSGEADPLDALRRAWKALDPGPLPPPPGAGPSACDRATDPATGASLAWLRAAWRELEPPPAEPPASPARLAPRRRARAALYAAAASAILAAGTWLLVAGPPPATVGPQRELASRRDGQWSADPAPVPESGGERTRRGARRSDGGVELRSGTVKLVLLPTAREAGGARDAIEAERSPRGAEQRNGDPEHRTRETEHPEKNG